MNVALVLVGGILFALIQNVVTADNSEWNLIFERIYYLLAGITVAVIIVVAILVAMIKYSLRERPLKATTAVGRFGESIFGVIRAAYYCDILAMIIGQRGVKFILSK